MTLISSSIPSFANGVSQQPFNLRLASQGERQVNGLSTVSQGLMKRPPTVHLKKLAETQVGNCFVHTINRDATERYVLLCAAGVMRVYDTAGVEKTVNFPDGQSYFQTFTPASSLSAVTVADYTFVVNKDVVVEEAELVAPTRPYEALVNVKLGNYGKTYKIEINGLTVAEYACPDGTTAAHSVQVSTDHIAQELYNDLTGVVQTPANLAYSALNSYAVPVEFTEANTVLVQVRAPAGAYSGDQEYFTLGDWKTVAVTWPNTTTISITDNPAPAGDITPEVRIVRSSGTANPWNAVLKGSVIYLKSTNNFSITTKDGFNGAAMVAIKDKLQKFTDLPPQAGIDGFTVEITGSTPATSSGAPFDSYYVRYAVNNTEGGVGTWEECAKPGIKTAVVSATMPHVLIREADGTFTFKRATYEGRKVGDENSNKFPSFVGRRISDVFFYRNRLGLLADEAVIFSEAGEYFNFMRTTVTQLLDSDPIDANANHVKVSLLKHAVPFNKTLMLFSDQTQFIVEHGELLTPKTIAIKAVTEFPCNTLPKPVGVGRNIYFPVDKGIFSAVQEFFTDSNNTGFDATDITAHVPTYMPSGIATVSACPNENMLVALTPNAETSLFVYRYFFANNEKLQSSWSEWDFGAGVKVLGADFIGSDLYLILNRPDGLYMEKITVALGKPVTTEPYRVHLDRKVQLSGSSLSYAAGYTTINQTDLGYTPSSSDFQVVVKSGTGRKAGEVLAVLWEGGVAKVKGDLTGATVAFGCRYVMTYELSTVTLKTTRAGQTKTENDGRLQLRKMALNYAESGQFNVAVTPQGRDVHNYKFSGKVLGTSAATIGAFAITDGAFPVPIVSRNIGTTIVISNDSPLPSAFIGADWEGFFVKRSQTV